MSWQAAVVRWAIRRRMRRGPPNGDELFGVTGVSDPGTGVFVRKLRAALDKSVASMPGAMRGTSIDQIDAGRVRVEWIAAPGVPKDIGRVILYCHGGGYFWQNLAAPRNMLARLSSLSGARVFSLDYRLAPEAPFPAALDDAAAAYSWLIEDQSIDPGQLAVGGASSGGGLALALLAAWKERHRPAPGAGFLFSPWTDLTLGGASIAGNAATDPVVTGADLRWAARLYLNGKNERTALASPLFADLSGLPPILVQVSSTEILLDDSKRLADSLRHLDGRCVLEVWPNMHHVWQLHSFFLPEGRRALAKVAQFLDETLAARNA